MNTDLNALLESAATTVFTTMLSYTVEFKQNETDSFLDGEMVAGTVGLTGAFNGMIYLYASTAFSRCITCTMLSMKDSEIESNEMVNDVIGELTNMVAGHVKTKLDNGGTRCIMTIPTVVRGKDFRVAPVSGAIRKTVYFQCNGGKVLLEALLKPQN